MHANVSSHYTLLVFTLSNHITTWLTFDLSPLIIWPLLLTLFFYHQCIVECCASYIIHALFNVCYTSCRLCCIVVHRCCSVVCMLYIITPHTCCSHFKAFGKKLLKWLLHTVGWVPPVIIIMPLALWVSSDNHNAPSINWFCYQIGKFRIYSMVFVYLFVCLFKYQVSQKKYGVAN